MNELKRRALDAWGETVQEKLIADAERLKRESQMLSNLVERYFDIENPEVQATDGYKPFVRVDDEHYLTKDDQWDGITAASELVLKKECDCGEGSYQSYPIRSMHQLGRYLTHEGTWHLNCAACADKAKAERESKRRQDVVIRLGEAFRDLLEINGYMLEDSYDPNAIDT